MKRTPLYENHRRLGGRIIDFGGWEMPVQYSGIIEEHTAVRERAGLFDVSHMGEIRVSGPGAAAFVQRMVTNDIAKAEPGQAVYSPMCAPDGGVVDDLLVYRMGDTELLLVVNAANTDKDYEWLHSHASADTIVENVSDAYAQIAIQGPLAEQILQRLCDRPLADIRFYHFSEAVRVDGEAAIVSRTGYTGEDGFEIYLAPGKAPALWDRLLEAGKDDGLVPAGLGARDTLRFEAALPLYGHELKGTISPLEAGLGMFVKLDKGEFIGREALAAQKEAGVKRKIAGFEMRSGGIPRSGFEVQVGGRSIGFVTSGSFAPSLKKNLGLALVEAEFAAPGTAIDIEVRGRLADAVTVSKPFYSKKYRK